MILGYLMYRSELVPRGMTWLGLIGGPLVMITASSLDDPASVKPTIAIYQKSAQPWDHVDPGLQKFPGPPTRG